MKFKGRTKAECINKAKDYFLCEEAHLNLKVIEEGSKGFLGIGAKDFVIEAEKKEEIKAINKELESLEELKDNIKITSIKEELEEEIRREEDSEKATLEDVKDQEEIENKQEEIKEENETLEEEKEELKENIENEEVEEVNEETSEEFLSSEEYENVKDFIEKFVMDIYRALGIVPKIEITKNNKRNIVDVSITGDETEILIGRHGQSLEALSMILNINISRKTEKFVRVVLDIEGYRGKRENSLRRYARKMADKVKYEKRNVRLDPMNAYERRIVHSELSEVENVKTFSKGEEPYRRVVISYRSK